MKKKRGRGRPPKCHFISRGENGDPWPVVRTYMENGVEVKVMQKAHSAHGLNRYTVKPKGRGKGLDKGI